jgi:ATP-binding cassette subfamily F protein uup
VIVVSHDRYFMDKVVDHLLVFNGQGDVRDFPGNYSQYREWFEEKQKFEKEKQKSETPKNVKSVPIHTEINKTPTKRKLSFNEKREMQMLEGKIAELENEKKNLEDALCSGQLSVSDLTEYSKRLPLLNDELDVMTMRWLELSEIEG